MNKKDKMIAVCGLKCYECDILQASHDSKMAQEIADWFKKERGEDVPIEKIHCLGCRGNRTQHWSPDCWILKCCVDEKGLDFCYECEEFPCERLKKWAEESKDYKEALNRLKVMRKK